jgi:hypothetical protein
LHILVIILGIYLKDIASSFIYVKKIFVKNHYEKIIFHTESYSF